MVPIGQIVMQNIAESCPNEFDVPKYDTVLDNHNYNYYQLQEEQNLYMQEDEMTCWLHYPFTYTNFLYPSSFPAFTDTMMPSSSGNATAELMIPPNPSVGDRKRKGKEKELECHNKGKKRGHGSTKRSQVAEVNKQSERRRRDRINQKLKALQELIPGSNKLDKASMLEEAIKYLKSLQMQVQMMSMVYKMVPVMFPGMRQNVPPLMVASPLPNVLTAASLSTPVAVATGTSHLPPTFSISPYQILPITSPNFSTTQSPSVSKF